jgi:predicted metal-dependent hydrolase
MIDLKILGYHSAQRYALRQTVVAAQIDLKNEYPDLKMAITEVKNWVHIEQYTCVLSAPSLVVSEKLVCVGRFPSRQDVLIWLRSAIEELSGVSIP